MNLSRSSSCFTLPLLWRAALGGLAGGGAAVAGLLLSGGGVRFAAAFAALGGLLLLAGRASARPAVGAAIRLTRLANAGALALSAGVAVGVLLAAPGSRAPLAQLPFIPALILLCALAGAVLAGLAAPGLNGRRMAAALALAGLAGLAGGLLLGAAWDIARFAVWGAASGAALTAGLCALLLRPGGESKAGQWLERGLLFGVLVLILYNSALPKAWDDNGAFNLYVNQASAFLEGRLDVDPFSTMDTVLFEGRRYVPFFPFPAVLLTPIVWAEGNPAVPVVPISLFSAAVTALAVVAVFDNLRLLGLDRARRYWLCSAFVFGTGLWLVTLDTQPNAAYFAHVVGVLALAGAALVAFGKRWGFAAGLLVGCGFLSRQMIILAAPFIYAVLLTRPDGSLARPRLRNTAGFALGVGLCVALYCLFAYLRFGNPFDTGYDYVAHTQHLGERFRAIGLFSLDYVPINLYFLFLKGFEIKFTGADLLTPLRMDSFGTSITVASPFLLLAVAARKARLWLWAAWASVLMILGSHLLYFNNGWGQLNTQRYVLDYLPLLILLLALALPRLPARLWKGLVLYSIALNVLALFVVPWPL